MSGKLAPTAAEISRAARDWCHDRDRETDGSDHAYFLNNWESLPGLRAYVEAQVDLGRPLEEAVANSMKAEGLTKALETVEPSALREMVRGLQSKLACAESLMAMNGWWRNEAGYLTDAALWIEKASDDAQRLAELSGGGHG